jgi:hypothetical protein
MTYTYGQPLKRTRRSIKKYFIGGFASLVMAISAASGIALAGNSGTGAEYHPQGSACGQYHGAFGYFGKDNNLGVKSDPTDPGADGQATGAANSAKGCQNNYPEAPQP